MGAKSHQRPTTFQDGGMLHRVLSLVFLASCAIFGTAQTSDVSIRYQKLRAEAENAYDKRDMKRVAETLDEASKLYALDGDMWWHYGQALLNQKRYDEATAALQKSLEFGAFGAKHRASVEYDLACAYSLMGKRQEGFSWLQKSMDHGLRDLAHLQEDADLKNLWGDPRWEELSATKDPAIMSRDEGWRYDLWLLNREVRRIHFDPYRVTPKATLDNFVRTLDRDIPRLSDNQIRASFLKFMVMIGDGHTSIRPQQTQKANWRVPLQAYCFQEGCYITAASPALKTVVGSKILKIEGRPISDVIAKVSQYIAKDNPMGTLSIAPRLMLVPAFMNGIGMANDERNLKFTLEDASGKTSEIVMESSSENMTKDWATARDGTQNPTPMYLKNLSKPYWFEYLPDSKLVYLQYNAVRNDANEDSSAFAARFSKFIDEHEVDVLVVDARWNGGGNSFLNPPIVHAIMASSKINREGHLFVIAGRQTFSAAQNFVTDLQRDAHPLFVGEPTGSSPNFVGETIILKLPYSGMQASISDLYWQRSWPLDNRHWIAPDLPAAPSFELYKDNRDPAMETILKYLQNRG